MPRTLAGGAFAIFREEQNAEHMHPKRKNQLKSLASRSETSISVSSTKLKRESFLADINIPKGRKRKGLFGFSPAGQNIIHLKIYIKWIPFNGVHNKPSHNYTPRKALKGFPLTRPISSP
jgi:hypothetical protein